MAVGNPLGAVVIWDGENPRTFTAKARETISGGQFVYISGAAAGGEVTSGASSFATSDLLAAVCDAKGRCNGIALNNVGSNGLVTVATRGTYIIKSAGAVSGGALVANVGAGDAVEPVGYSSAIAGSSTWAVVGRALTSAGSEGYAMVSLNL